MGVRFHPVFAKGAMQTLYWGMKRLPVNRCKVVFLSRQSDTITLDFQMLIEELRAIRPSVKVVVISRRLDAGWKNQIRYGAALLTSMYHLATSKVCVLDSYWPAVSVLDHKSDLVVFRMWHSLGKIKRSGRATVGMRDGRSREISELMRMHEGYDYVVAGAPVWNQFYLDSFDVSEDALLNIGLPRADYLVNQRESLRAAILEKYPEFRSGNVVLYAPTFRSRGGAGIEARNLVSTLAPAGFKVIVKGHANQALLAPDGNYWGCPEFSALELLSVADYLVTDYSAIAIEGALIGVRTFFYAYDLVEYTEANGLNIDLAGMYPGLVLETVDEVLAALRSDYPAAELEAFQSRYGLPDPGHSTRDLADAIFEKGGLCSR